MSKSCINTVLCTILDDINESSEKNVTIYVAIGAAAHSVTKDDITGIWSIDPKLDQQFPKFLKNLKEIYPFYPVYIILIDPQMEDPPFITWNMNKTGLGEGWEEQSNYNNFDVKSYYNSVTNIHVHSIKSFVQYPPDVNDKVEAINIESFFEQLNCDSIAKNWFTVVHDFCGKNMRTLAFYHDATLGQHINHIVYGLGARKDGGCFIDLLKPECNFVFTETPNGIKIFNAFSESNNTDSELINSLKYMVDIEEIGDKIKYDYQIIRSQIGQYIKIKRKFIMVELMELIRQVGMFVNKNGENINTIYMKMII